jgi:hypothetical protein
MDTQQGPSTPFYGEVPQTTEEFVSNNSGQSFQKLLSNFNFFRLVDNLETFTILSNIQSLEDGLRTSMEVLKVFCSNGDYRQSTIIYKWG